VTQLIQPSGESTGITEQGYSAVLTHAAGAAGSGTIQHCKLEASSTLHARTAAGAERLFDTRFILDELGNLELIVHSWHIMQLDFGASRCHHAHNNCTSHVKKKVHEPCLIRRLKTEAESCSL
jgi:hypothetical protein